MQDLRPVHYVSCSAIKPNKYTAEVEMQTTYKLRNSARRAARKEFPEGNFQINVVEGGFQYEGLEIVQTSQGEIMLTQEAVDEHVSDEKFAAAVNELIAEHNQEIQRVLVPTPVAEVVTPFVQQAGREERNEANPFALMLDTVKPVAAPIKGRVHSLRDEELNCPKCGADHRKYVEEEGDGRICNKCEHEWTLGAVKPMSRTTREVGATVRKGTPREKQNGVSKPREGTKCRQVWDECQRMYDAGQEPDSKAMRIVNDEKGWNMNNTLIEFYNWREFTGIKGRKK